MSHFALGEKVLAPWANDGFLYPAVLVHLTPTVAHVAYLDGDEGDVPLSGLRPLDIEVGQKVQVNWKGKGTYYSGHIVKKIEMGIEMAYDDGDSGWTTICQVRRPMQ